MKEPAPPMASVMYPADKGLRRDAIGMVRIVAVGLAAVAPAYSLAVTLGFVADSVGVHAPAAFLVGFLPILFTAFAFRDLNRVMPDCGGVFVWISRVLGPIAGWFFGGWVPQVATFIATAALAQVATVYLLDSVGLEALAENPAVTIPLAIALIAASAVVAIRGIELAAWVQYALIGLQIVAIGGFCAGAFLAIGRGTAPASAEPVSLDWFNPFSTDPSGLVAGVILALFIYWGWDSLISVNEETTHRSRTPGRAAIVSTVILLVLYVMASVAALGFGGVDLLTSDDAIGDVLSVIGPLATGEFFGRIITLAIGMSALSALFTVAVASPRSWLSMATYRALPNAIGTVDPKSRTPRTATIWWAGLSIATIIVLSLISRDFVGLAILSIGLMVAVYYAVTAIAAIVFFAPRMRDPKTLMLAGILPGLGALMMAIAFVVSAIDMARPEYADVSWLGIGAVFWIGIGALALGLVVTLAVRPLWPEFFNRSTIPVGNANSTDFHVMDPTEEKSN
ncbi:APC family permease [Paeniglutamicibacter sp. NPDC091659]|uniref:APC family permease n=1 Tax=Paeniglutamicibacter sp. NPDC091659 TaxID=3364389 RepID=UPI0038287B0D